MLRLPEKLTLGQAVKWLRAHDHITAEPADDGSSIRCIDKNRGDEITFRRHADQRFRLSEIDAWLEYDQPSK